MGYPIINGTDLFVFMYTNDTPLSATPLAHATSHTLSFKMATRDTSNKDSGIWLTKASGRMDVSATAEGLCAYGSFEDLALKMGAQTPLALYFGRKVATTDKFATSGTYASGIFYITSWDQTGGQEANATYNCNFEHCSGFAFVSGAAV
jgi:hypothetical protein